jgi:hypothetical protein
MTLKALWLSHNSEVNPIYSKQSTFTLHHHVLVGQKKKKKKTLTIHIPTTATE